MLLDWLHGSLHHWAIFCCTIATLGLIGAAFASVGICFGKGALGFLNGSGRQPTVIVVNGSGQYLAPPHKRTWGLGRTYLLFAAIFSGGPMLTLLIMAVVSLFWATVAWLQTNWVLPVGVLLIALVVGAVWLLIVRDPDRSIAQRYRTRMGYDQPFADRAAQAREAAGLPAPAGGARCPRRGHRAHARLLH